MATWADQRPPEYQPPIPQCAYLVRKGQEPDFERRSNIVAWSEGLAAHPKKWEQLKIDGKLVTTLPPTGKGNSIEAPVLGQKQEFLMPDEVKLPTPVGMRESQILSVFDQIEPDDIKSNGLPKIGRMQELTGFQNITEAEVRTLWTQYQSAQKESTG